MRLAFEKKFKPIIEPFTSLANIKRKEKAFEQEEEEEDTFEDAADTGITDDVLVGMIKKQLPNL